MQNTWVKFDEPSMYRHGLGTLKTGRSNMNHIVDMINIKMFTIDDYPISRDDRTWVLIWIMYHLDNLRDVNLSESSLVFRLFELKFIMNLVLIVFSNLGYRSIARDIAPLFLI